jgi:hypothetical protein
VIANFSISEHSWVVENVIDENAITSINVALFDVVVIFQNRTSLVDNSLMKIGQVLTLLTVFPKSGCEFVESVWIDERFILE